MTDLRNRLNELDLLDAPDMRASIDGRIRELRRQPAARPVRSVRWGWRGPLVALGTAVAIFAVVAVSLFVVGTIQGDVTDESAPTAPPTTEAVPTTTAAPTATEEPSPAPVTSDETGSASGWSEAALVDWMYTVVDVAVDPNGSVYAAAPAGIALLGDDGAWKQIDIESLPGGEPLDNGWPSPRIGNIAIGPDGALWAGGTTWSTVEDEAFGGVVAQPLGGFAPPARFMTWVARYECDVGPCSWSVATVDVAPGSDFDIGDMAISDDGTVYVTTGDNLLLAFDGAVWQSHTLSALPAGFGKGVWPWSSSLAVGADGVVWIGTNANGDPGWVRPDDFQEGRGLFAFDGSGFTRPTDDGLPGDRVFQVAAAPDGTIWAATDGPDPLDITIHEDGTEEVANSDAPTAAAAGIAHFDGTTWTAHTSADGLLSDNAAVFAGPDGTVWTIHTSLPPYGFSHFDGTRWTAYPFELPEDAYRVFRATVAPDGTLWMASDHAVISFDGVSQRAFPDPFGHA